MKRILLFTVLTALIVPANQASAVIDLTTSISIPNVKKWKVVQLFDYDDRAGTPEDPKYATVFIDILGTEDVVYRSDRLIIKDAPGLSTVLTRATSTPTNYNRYITMSELPITGAYTHIMAAYDGATGKAAKRKAVEVALITYGLMVGLDGTNSIR